MALSRHAYWHVLQYHHPKSAIPDHVWISDLHLASVFNRFVNCTLHLRQQRQQRRYESRVPGPLEARRRLAKRKNATAWVSPSETGVSLAGDAVGLFGKDGGAHLKWSSESQWDRSWPNPFGVFSGLAPQPALPTADHVPTKPSSTPSSPTKTIEQEDKCDDRFLEEFGQYLKGCRSVEDIYYVLDAMGLNIQQNAKYSSLAFNHLLLQCKRSSLAAVDQLVEFLDSPYLNVPHANNHEVGLKFMIEQKMPTSSKQKILQAIARNIRLGSLLTSEISEIIQLVGLDHSIPASNESERLAQLAAQYHAIWEAIQGCDVLRLGDFRRGTLLGWVDRLICAGLDKSTLLLAKDIILAAYREGKLSPCSRIPGLIVQCLRFSTDQTRNLDTDAHTITLDSIKDLLISLEPNIAARSAIQVTEYLAFTEDRDFDRNSLLSSWKDCLDNLVDTRELIMSHAWRSLEPLDRIASSRDGIVKASATSDHQLKRPRAVLRLWIISSLSRSFTLADDFAVFREERDRAVTSLLRMFQASEWEQVSSDSVSRVLSSILEMNLPNNDILMMVARATCPRSTRNQKVRSFLRGLESSQISLAEVFADVRAFRALRDVFFSVFTSMVDDIDITHSSFVENCLRMAETGDQGYYDILRILRSHTPLKIAVSKAWPQLLSQIASKTQSVQAIHSAQPHPNKASRFWGKSLETSSSPSGRRPLNPQACVDILHLLAVSLSGSSNIQPPRAFKLVRWVFRFLYSHNAPIKPELVRALYHSGVVRYRKAGLHVPPERYKRIMELVEKYEDYDILEEMETVRVG